MLIHDPQEYPCVAISHAHFLKMWKADNIACKNGEYNYWTAPKRVRKPSQKQLYEAAINLFAGIYRRHDNPPEVKNHDDAFRAIGAFIRKNRGLKHLEGQLIGFSMPLGARRALDYSSFFSPHNRKLCKLKDEQANLFGRAVVLGKQDKWLQIAETLDAIADVESKFKKEISKSI